MLGILVKPSSGLPSSAAETQHVHVGNRFRAHRQYIADHATDTRIRPAERLEG